MNADCVLLITSAAPSKLPCYTITLHLSPQSNYHGPCETLLLLSAHSPQNRRVSWCVVPFTSSTARRTRSHDHRRVARTRG
uniref:Uncharacterized protein n=1 Tax=Hyaloperonospora arabidopsidis (strain Emoy2) TaxID=559515 RepID=M4C2V1_HYAAE